MWLAQLRARRDIAAAKNAFGPGLTFPLDLIFASSLVGYEAPRNATFYAMLNVVTFGAGSVPRRHPTRKLWSVQYLRRPSNRSCQKLEQPRCLDLCLLVQCNGLQLGSVCRRVQESLSVPLTLPVDRIRGKDAGLVPIDMPLLTFTPSLPVAALKKWTSAQEPFAVSTATLNEYSDHMKLASLLKSK